MLSAAQNDFLTNVDPGAPMHDLMARYWLPAALSSDFPEPDSDPRRVTLLGKDYVAFRDSDGRMGLLRELCTHRGASLCLGRVERGGIRCIYHGWKFAVDGSVQEMPNANDERFKSRYRQPAFPVREAGGFVWAYVGPAEKEPPFPHYPFFDLPLSHLIIAAPQAKANFVQMIEGLVDSSHLGVLHADTIKGGEGANSALQVGSLFVEDQAPIMQAEGTTYGMRYVALRNVPDGPTGTKQIARLTAFALPCMTFIPNQQPGNGTCVISVPVSTDCTFFYHVFWNENQPLAGTEQERATLSLVGLDAERGMTGFGLAAGRRDLSESANRANNWRQDRLAMRAGKTFSGIMNFVPEDVAVMESMGAVYSREYETLLNSDVGVSCMRRVLIDNAERVQRGEEPIGLRPQEAPLAVQVDLREGESWRAAVDAALHTAT